MATEEKTGEGTLSAEEVQERLNEAYQDYIRTLNSAWIPEETRNRLEESHREFVRAVQNTWSQIDVAALDSNTLLSISQSLLAAAWTAASTGIR
jgi:cation transport regulator ChaB